MSPPTHRKAPSGIARRLLISTALALLTLSVACSPNASTPEPTIATATPAAAPTAPPFPTATPRPPSTPIPAPDLETVLADLIRITTEVRGLEPKEEVSQVFLLAEEMRERVMERLNEDIDEEELEVDRRILSMLGFIDPELNLKEVLVGLYGDAVLGYYDPKEKEMVVRQTGERIGPHEKVTFVHEFTHALQDQYFDLHGTREQLRELDNSDRHAAYLALVEGDAILAESIYIFEHMTEDEQILMFLGGGGMGPDLDEIPEYLIRTLLFPYIEGADFVLYLYRQGGWDAVNRAYEEPPLSSSHILHPQKYLEGEQPVDVDLGAIEDALHESWEVRQTDVMGEFVLYLHLELFLEEAIARQAARGWRGDRYVYLVDDADEELFVMRTHWDDATEAHRFFDAYNAFIDAQSGGAWSMSQANAGERRWQTGAGREVLLRHEGETVLLVLSPHGDATRDVMDALAE